MQNTIPRLLVAFFALGITAAYAGNVNVAVSVSGQVQPGVYGRINIGNAPPPPVVYEQPVLIAPPPRPMHMEPLYLHVPPGHARNWNKFCYKYDACGRPVYFVRSDEYAHDRHYAHHEHEHDYDRYRYHEEREEHHGHDDDHHDNGKHKGNKHHDRDD
ncbi:MAG: hypothetical protein ACXU8A_03635 [Burkholderiaceae bacterium]